MSGIYHLLIYLEKEQEIVIGKLGTFQFPAGYYVYTGSALNGLEGRIARHRRKRKRLHWHIDYLLQHEKKLRPWRADIADVVTHVTTEKLECFYNSKVMRLPGARIIAPRFGASDCKCEAHLVYFPSKPDLATLECDD